MTWRQAREWLLIHVMKYLDLCFCASLTSPTVLYFQKITLNASQKEFIPSISYKKEENTWFTYIERDWVDLFFNYEGLNRLN